MLTKVAHETKKYINVGLICIFFVLCANMTYAIHNIHTALPSEDVFRVANFSTDVVDHECIYFCSLDANFDSPEDIDDVIVDMREVKLALWSSILPDVQAANLPIVWQPLLKIPIA